MGSSAGGFTCDCKSTTGPNVSAGDEVGACPDCTSTRKDFDPTDNCEHPWHRHGEPVEWVDRARQIANAPTGGSWVTDGIPQSADTPQPAAQGEAWTISPHSNGIDTLLLLNGSPRAKLYGNQGGIGFDLGESILGWLQDAPEPLQPAPPAEHEPYPPFEAKQLFRKRFYEIDADDPRLSKFIEDIGRIFTAAPPPDACEHKAALRTVAQELRHHANSTRLGTRITTHRDMEGWADRLDTPAADTGGE